MTEKSAQSRKLRMLAGMVLCMLAILAEYMYIKNGRGFRDHPGFLCGDRERDEAGGLSFDRATPVKSCVWYAGDEEVQRTRSLKGYTPQSEDVEHFIRVEVTLKNGTVYSDSRYLSVLPVLYLNCDTAYDDMTKEDTASASMVLEGSRYLPDQTYDGQVSRMCGATVRAA